MKNKVSLFTDDTHNFLHFLKGKYPLFHDSNVFFRDLHYGVMAYLEKENISMSYTKSEDLAHQVIGVLEEKQYLKQIDSRTWLLQYPDFKKPQKEKQAAPPAAPAKVAQSSAPTSPAPKES